jgi:hypothetical protein
MEEKEVEEIQEKQNYLVNEIMNQNYDTEKFSEYMSSLKENGTDLNNWTFEELKNVVTSFKNQVKLGELNDENNLEKEVENVKNSFILQLSKNENDNNDNDNEFGSLENVMSDLNKDENDKKNNIFAEFEIIDESEFHKTPSKEIIKCIKQKENSLAKYEDLYVDITE